MAIYSRQETVTKQIDYVVPTGETGAPYTEVYKALAAAEREFRDRFHVPTDIQPADDALRVLPGDEEIVITFTVPVDD